MLTKFGNLDDFFNFLELKRAEIQTEFEIEMTTKELEELIEDVPDEITESPIENKNCHYGIQMAWSTSLETPKRTDTTLIMEQLNLNDDYNEVEDDFDEVDCFIDELIEDYSEIANYKQEGKESKTYETIDPLGLESLSFPMSQFPLEDFDYMYDSDMREEEESVILEEADEDDNDDRFDFDIPMSQFPMTQPQPAIETEKEQLVVGFKTGRGALLPAPSNEALKRAHSLMELDENVAGDDVDVKENLPPMPMFTTAKGKALPPPSEEAIKRARNLILSSEEPEDRSESVPVVGFKTGNGAKLPPPSKEALERAKVLISADDLSEPAVVGFSTAKGKALPPPSKEALDRAKSIISDHQESSGNISIGFSTAKGNSLPPPSKEALERAKGLISDLETTESTPSIVGFSTGKGKALPPPSEDSLKKAASLISSVNKEPTVKPNNPVKQNNSVKPVVKTNSFKPVKPAFSLSTAWKRPRKTAPLAAVKTEIVKLFDLDVTGLQRFKLKDFFKRTPNLSLSLTDYQSKYEIDKSILELNSITAQDYRFPCGWGVDSAHQILIQSGANPISISPQWTRNHYRWIVWKFASFIRTFPDSYSPANLSPAWVLSQLFYRYEREIHLCQRSAVKKIVERDDAAGKYLCLLVARIFEDKLELSDGWYSVWTCPLDSCLLELIENKRIHVGMKIEISGASITGQDAIPVLEASNPDSQCRLVICRNSCRPARWDTKLGFMTSGRSVAFLKHLHQIHWQGGLIPAVSVIVNRIYPLLFREQDKNISRNERDHFAYLETLSSESLQSIKITPIQRIKVIGNHAETTTTSSSFAVITFWNPMGEDQRALLQEGSAIIITNLRTSKPNGNAKSQCLVSSKSTRIFKDEALKISHIPTSKTVPFSAIKSLKVNESIDFDGIISLGRVGNYFWFCEREIDGEVVEGKSGIISGSSVLICLRNLNINSPSLQPGDLINFRDLTFNLFDCKSEVAHFSFTDFSDFKRAGRVEDVKIYEKSVKKFKKLIE